MGIAGLVGSGRSELAECIFGARETNNGDIYLEGQKEEIFTS